MYKIIFPIFLLLGIVLACSPPDNQAVAQAIPTSSPTTFPTSVPTTAPTSTPIYVIPGLPIYAPGTPPPLHVMTADYWLNSLNQGQYAEYLTFEYPYNSSQVSAVHNAGIKTVAYEDWAMPQGTDQELSLATGTYASAMAKDCSGNYIRTYNGTGYLFDPHSSSADAYLQAAIDKHYSDWAPDVIFEDNWNDLIGESTQPCDFSTYKDWSTSSNTAVSSVNTHGAQLIVNTLGIQSLSNQLLGINPNTVTGGEYEGCFTNGNWNDAENGQISSINNHKIFWCYTNGSWSSTDGSAVLSTRLYYYASFLLSYDPIYSVYQTWFKTVSGFRVMPETGLVPTLPIQTAVSNISELKNAAGFYKREFSNCYYRGVPLGPCVVVVNPSTTNISVSLPNYMHSMDLVGSDILDGGTVDFKGPQVTNLPPNSGAILFQ